MEAVKIRWRVGRSEGGLEEGEGVEEGFSCACARAWEIQVLMVACAVFAVLQ